MPPRPELSRVRGIAPAVNCEEEVVPETVSSWRRIVFQRARWATCLAVASVAALADFGAANQPDDAVKLSRCKCRVKDAANEVEAGFKPHGLRHLHLDMSAPRQ